jgi:hypothetical protein
MRKMRYYDFKRHWTKRIMPHLNDSEFNRVLVHDLNKFTWGRWRHKFEPGMLPEDTESCDWRWSHGRRGPMPRYWAYVKHGACHFLVNAALRLAMLTEPDREWRIITADKHSTVWDGDSTLFDLQFSALGVTPDEAYRLARWGGEVLASGKYRPIYKVIFWRNDPELDNGCVKPRRKRS